VISLENLRNCSTAAKLAMISPIAFVVGLVATSGLAGATAYDPTSDATSIATSAGTTAGPVVAAVFGAVIGLLVLFWTVKFVQRLLTRGR
jgi:hypothetical protein